MDRRTDVNRMREVIGLLKRYGIRTGTFIMVGYEGEQWADIDATAKRLCESLPDDVLTTLAYPIKGTPYYDDVADRIVEDGDWASSADREITVAGRHSRRFYHHTQKWLGAEVSLSRELARDSRNLLGLAKTFLRAKAYRAAMYLYRGEVEPAA
jgi:radical SAM superfamily enzyme YgiQ (UPF0313 family)